MVCDSIGPTAICPALFTSTSMRPKRSVACRIRVLGFILLRDVAGKSQHLDTHGQQALLGFVQDLLIAATDHDLRATRGELLRDRKSQAARATGDHHHLSGEAGHRTAPLPQLASYDDCTNTGDGSGDTESCRRRE